MRLCYIVKSPNDPHKENLQALRPSREVSERSVPLGLTGQRKTDTIRETLTPTAASKGSVVTSGGISRPFSQFCVSISCHIFPNVFGFCFLLPTALAVGKFYECLPVSVSENGSAVEFCGLLDLFSNLFHIVATSYQRSSRCQALRLNVILTEQLFSYRLDGPNVAVADLTLEHPLSEHIVIRRRWDKVLGPLIVTECYHQAELGIR